MSSTPTIPEGNLSRGLDEIAKKLAAFDRWPQSVEVEPWRGKFNLAQVKRYSRTFPRVFVTINGGERVRQGGTTYTDAAILAYIVTKGSGQKRRTTPTRGELGELIAERVFDALSTDLVWRDDGTGTALAGMPQGGRMDNALDVETDGGGLSIWFVGWTQPIEHSGIDDASLADLNTIVSTWNAEEFVPGANPDRPDPDNFPTGDDTSTQQDLP